MKNWPVVPDVEDTREKVEDGGDDDGNDDWDDGEIVERGCSEDSCWRNDGLTEVGDMRANTGLRVCDVDDDETVEKDLTEDGVTDKGEKNVDGENDTDDGRCWA